SAAPFMLFGHVDVVTAEADKWLHPPFSAELIDGVIWGRGTTDMKDMVVMNLMTFITLKRQGAKLKRDVIFMANADEETGGVFGAKWMVENHPELINAEYALTEGGGNAIQLDGQTFYTCSTGEKGSARFKLRGRGKPGHASQPHPGNAILALAKALQAVIEKATPVHITKTVRAHVEGLAQQVNPALGSMLREALDPERNLAALDALPLPEGTRRMMYAMTHNTTTPTILRGGTKINVVPGEVEAEVDCRVLPGATPESIAAEVRAIVGDGVEVEFGPFSPGIESDPASPLFELIKRKMGQGGGIVIPNLITGGTDARHVTKLGTKVYGFAPALYEGDELTGLAHAHNERVTVKNLMYGTGMIYDITKEFCC
ncbi:MAG TPA: M20/M25/M40 family metallo-hydrolase, partial [Thermoflexales bacterium]|nr:M20/M25/M40 family metallo-hydrolase [Thermoflexales bacterium]